MQPSTGAEPDAISGVGVAIPNSQDHAARTDSSFGVKSDASNLMILAAFGFEVLI